MQIQVLFQERLIITEYGHMYEIRETLLYSELSDPSEAVMRKTIMIGDSRTDMMKDVVETITSHGYVRLEWGINGLEILP